MKKIFLFISFVSLIISCSNPKKFSSEHFDISFNYPDNWEIAEDTISNMVQIYSNKTEDDEFQEMINVVVGGTNHKGLDEFFQDNLNSIQGMFDELDQTQQPSFETINGLSFKKVRYNYVFAGFPLTAQLFVAIKEGNSYIINCSALQNTFDDYQAEFNGIIQSIEVK